MIKQFCVDTSGFSNPLETMPDDLYQPLWDSVCSIVADGILAVNVEVYEEMKGSLFGVIGEAIDSGSSSLILEIGDDSWKWKEYTDHLSEMTLRHQQFIAEYTGRKRTVGLVDLSIVALAKTLNVPLVSMERPAGVAATKCRKIPDICRLENVEHLDFNGFLRAVGVSLFTIGKSS